MTGVLGTTTTKRSPPRPLYTASLHGLTCNPRKCITGAFPLLDAAVLHALDQVEGRHGVYRDRVFGDQLLRDCNPVNDALDGGARFLVAGNGHILGVGALVIVIPEAFVLKKKVFLNLI